MKFKLSLGDRTAAVDLMRSGDTTEVLLDGQRVVADARWLDATTLSLIVDGQSFELVIETNGEAPVAVTGPGARLEVGYGRSVRQADGGVQPRSGHVTSPMPGKIVDVMVKVGQQVEAGQGLIIVEAMKMENELAAPGPGVITAVNAQRGQVVDAGAVLVEVGPGSS